MRVAYLISWRGGSRTGPFEKMAAQARYWSAAGHTVGLFVVTSDGAHDEWAALPEAAHVAVSGGSLASGFTARRAAFRALRQWRPEVVYLRHGIYAPGLRRIVTDFPTVAEINGDEVAIARQTSRIKAIWALMTRPLVLRRLKGAVFMTSELANGPRFRQFSFRRCVIPNGIDLARTEPLPASADPDPGLVMLGHPDSAWHGGDKLVPLARRHPTWRFDVIGPRPEELGPGLPPNLRAHPELDKGGYLPILARADIGVGTLAMHRINANENPALKVREYLARGLAVLTGCHDPDFDDDPDFILELPNEESNIEENDRVISDFVARWHGRRIARQDIGRLDLPPKEQQRLDFIAECARLDRGPMTEKAE